MRIFIPSPCRHSAAVGKVISPTPLHFKSAMRSLFQRLFFRDLDFSLYVLGLSMVAVLAMLKHQNETEMHKNVSAAFEYIPRPQLHTKQITLPTHGAHIMSRLVLTEEYAHFVQDTGYRTYRERRQLKPTWQDLADQEPVGWLVREDAERYCRWLSDRAGQRPAYPHGEQAEMWRVAGFRLPQVEELAALEAAESSWEWTADDLGAVKPDMAHANTYLTSWKQGELLHRRTVDLGHSSDYSVGFRVAWTVEGVKHPEYSKK